MFVTVTWKAVQFLFWSTNPLSDNSNSTSANGTAMLRWGSVKGWWLSMIIVDQWSYWGLSWCLKRQARRKSAGVKSKSDLSNSFEANTAIIPAWLQSLHWRTVDIERFLQLPLQYTGTVPHLFASFYFYLLHKIGPPTCGCTSRSDGPFILVEGTKEKKWEWKVTVIFPTSPRQSIQSNPIHLPHFPSTCCTISDFLLVTAQDDQMARLVWEKNCSRKKIVWEKNCPRQKNARVKKLSEKKNPPRIV